MMPQNSACCLKQVPYGFDSRTPWNSFGFHVNAKGIVARESSTKKGRRITIREMQVSRIVICFCRDYCISISMLS